MSRSGRAGTVTELTAMREQLTAELAHWRYAVDALADLDVVASPEAWAGLEQYVRVRLRDRMAALVTALRLEAAQLDAEVEAAHDPDLVHRRLLRLRRRYLQLETILDFYGHAIGTRTNPEVAALLRGFDTLASDSLEELLRPLGLDGPPVLVYLTGGLGAAILRADVRLWDGANPSPVAAIKLTRQNLGCPTSLFHETGHQFAHLTGWTGELAMPWRRCWDEGPSSWLSCGGAGPARWPPMCTLSAFAGGHRSLP